MLSLARSVDKCHKLEHYEPARPISRLCIQLAKVHFQLPLRLIYRYPNKYAEHHPHFSWRPIQTQNAFRYD